MERPDTSAGCGRVQPQEIGVPHSRGTAKNGKVHLVPPRDAPDIVKAFLKENEGGKLLPARWHADVGPSGCSNAMTRIRMPLEVVVGERVPQWTLHDLH